MKKLIFLIIILFGCQESTSLDCSGVWGGTAYIDSCGNCVGGNTDEIACVQDCDGIFGGIALADCLGNCSLVGDLGNDAYLGYNPNLMFKSDQTLGSINSATEDTLGYDCAGECDGTATVDNCDICVSGDTGLTACVQDCAGTWGGTAIEDECGVCDTDSENDCSDICVSYYNTWQDSYNLYVNGQECLSYRALISQIIGSQECTFSSNNSNETIIINQTYLDSIDCGE